MAEAILKLRALRSSGDFDAYSRSDAAVSPPLERDHLHRAARPRSPPSPWPPFTAAGGPWATGGDADARALGCRTSHSLWPDFGRVSFGKAPLVRPGSSLARLGQAEPVTG